MMHDTLPTSVENIIVVNEAGSIKGGAEKVAIESAIELSKRYHVVFFCAVSPVCDVMKNSAAEVVCLNLSDVLSNKNKMQAICDGIWNRKAYRGMKATLNRFSNKNTIVHVHSYTKALSCSVFKACEELQFKTVLTLHEYFSVCPNGGFYNYQKKQICTKKPMSTSCVLCHCDKRNYLQKIWRVVRQIPINKYVRDNKELHLFYISNFSYDKLKPCLGEHAAYYLKNPYDLGEDIVYHAEQATDYIFVGRLSEEKGVDVFCEAYSRLLAENKIKGNALVVGSGEKEKELKAKYPNVQFLGWKTSKEIAALMPNIRVLVFPSKWYETAGLVPIEFMSHGIPCIIADQCAAIDYIEDGTNGLLFQSQNVEDLMEKMKASENDNVWDTISWRLRNDFILDDYSLQKHCNQLNLLYAQILKKRQPQN